MAPSLTVANINSTVSGELRSMMPTTSPRPTPCEARVAAYRLAVALACA
ncbi:Uncharacterised protein [Mycobacteroides abscessus subsp. abscessus]|nr:Uncharacterised protein [Mycobacteroides abscessus subsp. abscessus]SIN59319.1 Uncharacterised protein [Mycobacteroides abscessus subsp. abscessus]SKV99088.1 Uncharacterised protein [Mycobacteroides abscessus subsp. abscessus]